VSNTIIITDPRDLQGHAVGSDLVGRVPKEKSGPPLIKRNPGEPLATFYTRAEQLGVGRRCLQCGFRRRYSMVNCPMCTSSVMTECRFQPGTPDREQLPVELPPTNYDTPEGNGAYSYTPINEDGEPVAEKDYINANELPASARRKTRVAVPNVDFLPPETEEAEYPGTAGGGMSDALKDSGADEPAAVDNVKSGDVSSLTPTGEQAPLPPPVKPLDQMNKSELTDYARKIGLTDLPARGNLATIRQAVIDFVDPPKSKLPDLPPVDHEADAKREEAELNQLAMNNGNQAQPGA